MIIYVQWVLSGKLFAKVRDLKTSRAKSSDRTVRVLSPRENVAAEEILHWLGYFGTVTGDVMEDTFGEECGPTLAGIPNGDLYVKMKLDKEIPSFLPIAGRRTKIIYELQERTCAKCYSAGHFAAKCPNEKVKWVDHVKKLKAVGLVPNLVPVNSGEDGGDDNGEEIESDECFIQDADIEPVGVRDAVGQAELQSDQGDGQQNVNEEKRESDGKNPDPRPNRSTPSQDRQVKLAPSRMRNPGAKLTNGSISSSRTLRSKNQSQ